MLLNNTTIHQILNDVDYVFVCFMEYLVKNYFIRKNVFICSIHLGKEKYGKCIKYAVGESKPALNGDRYCITSGKYVYCREVECPATQCVKPLVPSHGACPYCPGKKIKRSFNPDQLYFRSISYL